jgi:hypothetical protein
MVASPADLKPVVAEMAKAISNLTDPPGQLRVAAEAGNIPEALEQGERPPLEAVTNQQLVKTEKTLCLL